MTQPIGEEFIRIRPDLSGFKAELQAQVAAAMQGVQKQVAAAMPAVQKQAAASVQGAQRQAAAAQRQVATAASRAVPPIVLPSSVQSIRPLIEQTQATEQLQAAIERAAAAQKQLVIPPGVRTVAPTLTEAATAANALAAATARAAAEQKTLILPPGVRAMAPTLERAAVATDAVTAATARLVAAQQAAGRTAAAPQIATARQAAAATAGRTAGGVILPPGIRSLTATAPAAQAAAAATTATGNAASASAAQVQKLTNANRAAAVVSKDMSETIRETETAVARYSRGMLAATAASTGFFRAVSFASGAFLVGATIGATIGTAVNEFNEMTRVAAQSAALIKATGGAANVTAGQVEHLSEQVLNLTGVDDEQVRAGANVLLTFRNIRNEVGPMNDIFTRATKAVVDISSVFKTDLRGSAVQLGKALQDPIKGVTALRRSGITLSEAQRELIKRMVESGRILSAQKLILGEVERQVGGTAEAIGRTLPGRLRILREQSVNALGEYVRRISESRRATELFTQVSLGISQTFGTIKQAIQAVGPPLLSVIEAFSRVTQAVGGAGAILAAVVAYKAVGAAIGIAAAAQRLYARAVEIATGVTVAQTAANTANATAFAASAAGAAAAAASTATPVGRAAQQVARTGVAARAAAAGLGAGRVALAAVGGPAGAAAIAVGALAVGLFKLHQIAQNAPGSVNAVTAAFKKLNDEVERARELRGDIIPGRREAVETGRAEVRAAQAEVARRQRALRASPGEPGSLETRGRMEELAIAEKALDDASRSLAKAVQDLDRSTEELNANEGRRPPLIERTTQKILDQVDAAKRAQRIVEAFGKIPIGINLAPREFSLPKQLRETTDLFEKLGQSTDSVTANAAKALFTLQVSLDRLATPREIKLAVRRAGEGASANTIARELLHIEQSIEQVRLRGLATEKLLTASFLERVRAARALVRHEFQRLQTLRQEAQPIKQQLRAQRDTVAAAKEAVQAAREGLAAAIRSLADARRGLREAQESLRDTIVSSQEAIQEAIRASKQAVTDAIQSAKSNLDSLGQSLADMLGTAKEELGSTAALPPAVQRRIAALREQARAGKGGPETQQAARQIQFLINQNQPKIDTDKIAFGFRQLTDELNRGLISLPQFNKRVKTLLSDIDLKALAKVDPALARQIQDTITAATKQAASITAGPQRGGGGDQPTVVNIQQVIREGRKQVTDAHKQAAKDIKNAVDNVSAAERSVADATRDVTKAQTTLADSIDTLRKEQKEELRLNSRWIRANTKVQEERLKFDRAQAALRDTNAKKDKTKPSGSKNKQQDDMNQKGAFAP